MPVVGNRYYNDPMIGQAFANLGAMFAPPSAQDTLAYTTARAKREEAQRLADLFRYSTDPNFNQTTFDRMGMGAGAWNPSQSIYAVDQGNATQRYGYDTSAATSRANNAADNQRSLVGALYGPIGQNQVRPALPGSIAGMFGLPDIPEARGPVNAGQGDTVTLPNGQVFNGTQKPPSVDEFTARILGQMPPEQQQSFALRDVPVEQVVGPDGRPQIVTRNDAIGQQPFINKGAEARPQVQNYITPSGQKGTAVYDTQAGTLVDTQTRQPLPAGSSTYNASLQGGVSETGLGKPVTNDLQNKVIANGRAKQYAQAYRDLVSSNQMSQGAVGFLRGTAQDFIQTGGEVGAFFGGSLAKVQNDIAAGMADANLGGLFDPSLPAMDMAKNLLAYYVAQSIDPTHVSNQTINQVRSALGLNNVLGNQADTLARIDQLIGQLDGDTAFLQQQLGGGGMQPNAPAAPAAPAGPPPGQPMIIQTPKGPVTIQRVQ